MLKQFVKTVLGALAVILVVQVMGLSAFAQLPPAMSPWLGLSDPPSNRALGTYLGDVKPKQDMLKAYAAQARQIQSQQQALQAMQNNGSSGGSSGARDLVGGGAAMGSNNPLLAPPREIPTVQRNPAGFYQYLHYYPAQGLPRQPVPNFSSTGRRM